MKLTLDEYKRLFRTVVSKLGLGQSDRDVVVKILDYLDDVSATEQPSCNCNHIIFWDNVESYDKQIPVAVNKLITDYPPEIGDIVIDGNHTYRKVIDSDLCSDSVVLSSPILPISTQIDNSKIEDHIKEIDSKLDTIIAALGNPV